METPRSSSRRWLRPPRLRTLEHGTGERHASWLELFFDLVLVVAIAQLAHLFAHHPDGFGAFVAAGLFAAVFLAWQGFTAYADRFDTDDLPFRLATFVQMLALLAMGVMAADVVSGRHAGFAVAFATLRAVLVALYARAYRHAPDARPLIRRYAGAYSVSVLLWLVSALLPDWWWATLWGIALVLDLSMPPLNTRLHRSIPTDPAHLPERFGLFTIVVLGELIVAVGIGTVEARWSASAVSAAVLGFAVAACLWWLYFERLTGQELPRSPVPIVTYAYTHLPLLAALMFVAGGVSVLVRSEAQPAAGAWALCAGVAVFLASLALAHAQLLAPLPRWVNAARWLCAVVILCIPLLVDAAVQVTGLTLGMLVALVIFEGVMCKPAEQSTVDQTGAGPGSPE